MKSVINEIQVWSRRFVLGSGIRTRLVLQQLRCCKLIIWWDLLKISSLFYFSLGYSQFWTTYYFLSGNNMNYYFRNKLWFLEKISWESRSFQEVLFQEVCSILWKNTFWKLLLKNLSRTRIFYVAVQKGCL